MHQVIKNDKYRKGVSTSENGVVLLVSLVILSLVVFSVIGLSAILINEIRSSRYVDNAIVAHYAAESGAERSLFLLQEARGLDEDPNGALLFGDADLLATHRVLSSDSERVYTYTNLDTTSETFSASNVPVNTSVEFDIFDPEQEDVSAGTPDTSIERLIFEWELADCNGGHQIEVSTVAYTVDPNQITIDATQPVKEYFICNCTGTGTDANVCKSGVANTQFIKNISPLKFYHVSMRPIDSEVASVSISTDDGFGTVLGIPSQVNIVTEGAFRDATQVITVQTPWNQAVSDLFDYVIFTETDLVKSVVADINEPFEALCGVCHIDQTTPCSIGDQCAALGLGYCVVSTDPNRQPFCYDEEGITSPDGEFYDLNQNGLRKVQQLTGTGHGGICNYTCTGYTYCGDGYRQNAPYPNGAGSGGPANDGIEECDDGDASNQNACDNSCQLTFCGDGITQSPNGKAYIDSLPGTGFIEQCDDANTVDNDTCSNSCQLAVCGDGVKNGAEACDRTAPNRCSGVGFRTYYINSVGCPNATDACNATCTTCATQNQCFGISS